MPRFTLGDASALSVANREGRAFVFVFPYETEDVEEIEILTYHGAVESAPVVMEEPLVASIEPVRNRGRAQAEGGDS